MDSDGPVTLKLLGIRAGRQANNIHRFHTGVDTRPEASESKAVALDKARAAATTKGPLLPYSRL